MRTLESLGDLRSKSVVIRCDLNVPLSGGEISDDGRIRAALGTIRELRDGGSRVIVISHLGRPGGTVQSEYSLRPVAERMAQLLESPVEFAGDTIGVEARTAREQLADGDVLLLENLRFHAAETSAEASEREAFAQALAIGADAYVSDGFGVVHRRQASVTELAGLLPSAAGRLVEQEVAVLSQMVAEPQRPFTVVLGGSKVSDKLGVIAHLLERVDTLIVGGGMLFTFLAAQGHSVGASLLEADQLDTVHGYLDRAQERGVNLVLPTDVVVAEAFAADAAHETVAINAIESSRFGPTGIGLDIGPESAARFAQIIHDSATVFWNGPMGVFEMPAFSHGTRVVATALQDSPAFTVVGGGDSAAAIRLLGFEDSRFNHISTGGGASLELLEGKQLPGLEVLN